MKDTTLATERAWIELNIENLQHNVRTLQKAMPAQCKLMAVVKAEAYGHGACEVAVYLNRMGVSAFAVATVGEGIKLRKCGIRGEILILGYTNVHRAPELKEYDLMQTLIDLEYAEALNQQGIMVKAHVKIDTGMHRLGIPWQDFPQAREVFNMRNLDVCGIYTHLCCADRQPGSFTDDDAFTKVQISRFYRLVNALKDSGIKIPKLHIQSSYGLLNYPGLTCDYVRAGIALYGILSAPEDDTVLKPDLRPVLSLKSRVILIRFVEKGESIGYGRTYTAGRNSRIAILPVGYADGFPRSLSDGKGHVRIRHYVVPVAGRICMDQLAVDITDAEDVTVGDIATLVSTEGDDGLSAADNARKTGSISNEFLCRMGQRLPVVVSHVSSFCQPEYKSG